MRVAKSCAFLLCLIPLVRLVLGAFGLAGVNLGPNPVEYVQDTLGIWGLRFLLITLAVTPLRQLTGWNRLAAFRRMLGLFAFTYVLLHFLTYAMLDLRLDFAHLGEDVLKRPFITIGALALLLLIPLAATSTNAMMRRLGRNWRKLHRLVYPIAILGVWHYYWQVKLDTLEPTVYAVTLAILLGSRLWRYRRRRAALATAALILLHPVPDAVAVDLQFTRVTGLGEVTDIRHAGDGSGRVFLAEQPGSIRVLRDGELLSAEFLNIADRLSNGNEQGLLSLVFAPDYPESGNFYVWYTDELNRTVLSRLAVTEDPDLADAGSEEIILRLDQPYRNHNGGRLVFGRDGFLYVSIGDGGGANDPNGNAQNMDSLLGKIIRIDVDPAHGTYAVPPDNPFVGDPGARDEIWASGLRNPWRIGMDRSTGDFFVADVGQSTREEVNFQPADSVGGENYGWNIFEGTLCSKGPCDVSGLTAPIAEYPHTSGCAVTGGEVYRGQAYPDLHGTYLYGDYCSGRVWGLARTGEEWANQVLADTDFTIVSFGEAEDGSVYLSSRGDGVYLISDGLVAPERPFSINPGISDAWFDDAIPGQGFLIVVFPEQGIVFLAWFTYDIERPPEDAVALLGEPGHRWMTAQGPFDGDTAVLDVYLTEGGVFDRADPAPSTLADDPIGTISIVWHDCEHATLTYDIDPPGVTGEILLRRFVPDNAALCEALMET